MRRLATVMAGVILLGLACLIPCQATPFTNGDFETGTLSPWAIVYPAAPLTPTGPFPSDVINISSAAGSAHNGTYGIRIVNGNWGMGVVGMITQTVDTVVGQSYLLSYWLKMGDALGADLATVAWGAAGCDFVPSVQGNVQTGPCSLVPGSWILLDNNSIDQSFGWTQFTYTVTATGSSMAIALAGRSDFATVTFDDVSLTPSAIPEPATVWLSGTVLLAGMLLRRRR